MRVQDFIIALMFMITSSVVVLALVFDVYGARGYDIDLEADNATAVLAQLQTKANTAQSDVQSGSDSIWDKTVGQSDATIDSGSVSEGDMIKSSVGALTNIGDFVDVFTTLLSAFFTAIGLDGTSGAIYWFLSGSLVIIIGLLLISSVLRNYI